MLPILLAATPAGNFLSRNTHFGMNDVGKLTGQIVLEEFAVETVQTAWRRQGFFIFHIPSRLIIVQAFYKALFFYGGNIGEDGLPCQ